MTRDQAGDVRTLARQAGIKPTVISVDPGDARILALTGPHAPLVTPPPVVAPRPQVRSSSPKPYRGRSESSASSRGGAGGRRFSGR
jgi:hypothetical protein